MTSSDPRPTRSRPALLHDERGVALALALFLMSALSVLAASMMFLSQTETYSSMNYRMMSQARYAAEAGVQRAGNFLFDPAQYAKSGTTNPLDPLANYDFSTSPVKYNGNPVILSTIPGVVSNYPVAAVVTAFNNAAQGTLTVGNQRMTYRSAAKLISMQTFDPYGGSIGTPGLVQTWEITSTGTLNGSRPATVEVVAYAEQPIWSANSYAAFATGNTCGAMAFNGDVTINSYDSSTLSG